MHSSFHPVHWLVFNAVGLLVQGVHTPDVLSVHPRLQSDFDAFLPAVRSRVLARTGGFDGPCAALTSWAYTSVPTSGPARLSITTGMRTYCQSNTLKQLMVKDVLWAQQRSLWLPNGIQPDATCSWGSSLTTVVLLPGNSILVGKRSDNLQTNPSKWSCLFTEILEPSDVTLSSMEPLLDRLVQEELPFFKKLGLHRFVGLMLVPECYTWTLVSVLDLRALPIEPLDAMLATLSPDEETQAWTRVMLHPVLDEMGDSNIIIGLALARSIADCLQ